MNAAPSRRVLIAAIIYAVVLVASSGVGALGYFHFASNTCASCHEMAGVQADWSASAHRSVACRKCHGGALTLDVHVLRSHVRRVVTHFTGGSTRAIHLKEEHVLTLHQSCRSCHPQAFAEWQASRHSTTLGRIFLDAQRNRAEAPADDCLRCHAQFFSGDIRDLVTQATANGPWMLKDPSRSAEAAIPCLTCHQVHAPAGERQIASFYFRREQMHVAANLLPVVLVNRGDVAVKVSRDPRQRVCAQCHAPTASHLLASSDDRTPAGVHEGLSCRDCHWSHTNSAIASCGSCHPADSHCGLDVEKMDTTFRSRDSQHNVHTVACIECHAKGVPQRRPLANLAPVDRRAVMRRLGD